MRLSSFRIRNFRSIVDTSWQNISPDNITCLIGQNESGKTSILEGLLSFFTGEISEDVLRSDLSLPEVSCRFDVPAGYVATHLAGTDSELEKLADPLTTVTLVRSWKADLESEIIIGGEIFDFIDSLENERREKLTGIEDKIMALDHEFNVAEEKIRKSKETIESLEMKLTDEPRKGGLKLFRKKENEDESDRPVWEDLKKKLEEERETLSGNRKLMSDNEVIAGAVDEWNSLKVKYSDTAAGLAEISSRLEERHQTMTLLSGQTLEELSLGEWEKVLRDYKEVSAELDSTGEKVDLQTLKCGLLMDGSSLDEANATAKAEASARKARHTPAMLGELFFSDCPAFGIFEDFGSLLPNRIDLDDMIMGNEQVEGFKAARNFLTIANLDYSFFQQPSSRILKQKIENLNAKLTLDFQDFWQQYVGQKNKIRINFELDHYSTSHGSKAGKPYLEFWVKDEGERLYPKQRSRGVRWFLSFYLELMASSVREKKRMVLLVDEPGVSLHARAQEDVLKVFEDIKENIQVIYTTHSPHLVDINKLHRVLAVQRDDVQNQRSATTILDAARLADASPDTLSPLQSIMGNPVGNHEFSVDKFNIIVNDVGTFYFMNAALKLTGYKGMIHFIPSTDPSSIPLMCNIFMGWGMKFSVLLFNSEEEKDVESKLRETIFINEPGQEEKVVVMPEHFGSAEDLFSTLDFKNYILHSREGITVRNSDYIKGNEIPRNFLLSKFLSDVNSGKVARENLDEESRENLMLLVNILQKFR